MCGIFAVFNAPQQETCAKLALNQARKLHHRGPDDFGNVVRGQAALCHCRLSIVDPDHGRQPFSNSEGTVFLVANAEIYNHLELRAQLEAQGASFYSNNDCEVLIHAYTVWGDNFFNRLDGFFALVILDLRGEKPRLIVARDPIGVTSLYYSVADIGPDGSRSPALLVGSELKSVCSTHESQVEAEPELAIRARFIATFPPGHWLSTDELELDTHPLATARENGGGLPTPPSEEDERWTKGPWPQAPSMQRYFDPFWWSGKVIKDDERQERSLRLGLLRAKFCTAVRKRLLSHQPIAFLLSGGLDSSLVCLAASEYCDELKSGRGVPEGVDAAFARPISLEHLTDSTGRLRTYTVGLVDAQGNVSGDVLAARKVAKHLDTSHTEVLFTADEGISMLKRCIYHIETFDRSTVRSSVPLMLLARRIHQDGVKVLVSGEGSDEIFGGYMYLADADNAAAFHDECVSLIKNVHVTDTIRINKVPMAFSIETRAPFVDKQLMEEVFRIDAGYKMFLRPQDQVSDRDESSVPGGDSGLPIGWRQGKGPEDKAGRSRLEKYPLRAAFDAKVNVEGTPRSHRSLPESVLWRRKEQFSDGVGNSWAEELRQHAEHSVREHDMMLAREKCAHLAPTSKEEYLYRALFQECFPTRGMPERTVQRWQAGARFGSSSDPSGFRQ